MVVFVCGVGFVNVDVFFVEMVCECRCCVFLLRWLLNVDGCLFVEMVLCM